MNRYQNGSILADVDVLEDDCPLEDTELREGQIKKLWFCLSPIEKGKIPLNCWLYGEPGTGKTAIAKFVLNQLESVVPVKGVCVNCWGKNTFYGVLDRIITDLRILGPEKPATTQKLELLQKYLKDNTLITILDDIDRPAPVERDNIIYNLCTLPRQGLICISTTRETIFELEQRIKSRLNAVRIEFPNYTTEELLEILIKKAEQALVKETWDKQTLKKVAELAAGDARIAIQTLRDAAYYAQKENCEKIDQSHVLKGWSEIREEKKSHLLGKLTQHHSLLYNIIKGKEKVMSNELWKLYLKKCKESDTEPISTRTYPNYVNELRDVGLVKIKRAPVKGKVREIEAC